MEKLGGSIEKEMLLIGKKDAEPCFVNVTGLGPSPSAMMRFMLKKYSGVTSFKVDGEKAAVEFSDWKWAEVFRGELMAEWSGVVVGEIFKLEEGNDKVENNKDTDLVETSVAVRRKEGKVNKVKNTKI